MSPRPLVSAIMPAYNAEEFLEAALASVVAQDYDPFELIVVDDGSIDRTRAIAESFAKATVISQPNKGRAGACNTAIRASKGEFVCAFDADDLWPANRLTLQATFLSENPHVGCVLGRQEWINPPPWLGRDAVFGDLDGIPIGSAMFRREVLDRLGGFDESFLHSEDMDLLVRVRELGVEIAILPEIIWYRRYHAAQMTANGPTVPPLLRSLREKLARERAASEAAQ
jgi:glycosyltransferase involved in cell wall biosynthesis